MSSKFTCRFCKEQFDQPKGLYKHLQLAHNAGISRDNKTCPICGVLCSKYESYRDHLLYIHGQTDEGQKLSFKSLNDFLVWKTELELKHNCKYVLQTSPKVLPTKEKKYFYQCDRSNSKSKDKKSVSVVMKTCSSVISVVEGAGIFKVEYWDTHSGHSEPSSVPGVQTQREIEAAVSSVEMVNAIAGSDDSFDQTEELLMPENSNSSVSDTDKQAFIYKTNSGTNNLIKSAVPKIKTLQSGKMDMTKKKTNNTSVLFSLASVACGKGISKKSSTKINENNNADNQPSSKLVDLKSVSEQNIENSADSTIKQKDILLQDSKSTDKPVTTLISTTTSSSLTVTKTTPSGPLPIAPKTTTVTSNTINPLFATNSTFSNQFVIVNPVSMDQNSLNSNSVFTTAQNILLSLGPIGQNASLSATAQTTAEISGGKKTSPNSKVSVSESSVKVNKSNTFSTARKSFTNSQSVAKCVASNMTSAVTSNSPITLTPGLNNAPVILSSLPVGSTFMSVNNNLIPIATPSGTFLPTNLPPNVVLTPVVPGTSLTNVDSSNIVTTSSANIPSSQSLQAQTCITTPSTVAITVSSIVKEPVYTSSAIKHISNIITSDASLPSSPAIKNARQRSLNKFVPITTASRVSVAKNENKSSSSPRKSLNKNLSNVDASGTRSASTSKISNKVSASLATSTLVSPSEIKPSARKRMARTTNFKATASPSVMLSNDILSPCNTSVVNSRLHLTPISSTPSVTMTSQFDHNHLSAQKPGTMFLESSAGDVYMLEPIENDENPAPTKIIPSMEMPKIRIERSVQTNESSAFNSDYSRKRVAPPTDDSAVMLKVKCYQLEMQYLNIQAECKRLKVELTKERLKNADVCEKTAVTNLEDDSVNKMSHTKAAEIMKEIEDRFSGTKDVNIYTMTKTSVLRSLYEDLEELCTENNQLYKELESYRAHDKFYKNLKKRLYEEEF